MNDIKVSIIMGIYNCASTLPGAIESIINQTFTSWELIMCDDGSIDNTYDTANKYKKEYPDRIILIRNKKNMGLNYTLNKCLNIARGEYIARMDGDDISLQNRLKLEVDFLDNHPEYSIVSSPMIYFDEYGEWGVGKAIEIPQIKDFVFHAPFHCHAPCMIRKYAFLDVGGYTVDKKLLRFEDCNLWYKLYAAGYRGYNIQTPLYKMRDDRDAYHRRDPKSRLRSIYVQMNGFKIINMKKIYYPFLLIDLMKSVMVLLMPYFIYDFFHRRKINCG